ncbi:15090_t:CDS:1 [Acaulospora colombiana]|uniref:15090_t:CDS:1 n=1 Tax=Acaulospora colombiana TaxID=27376 RepID=A0ACA9LZT0_9GLOM|nr:15090_t:CDS:1 [Acaulospora colombiana]
MLCKCGKNASHFETKKPGPNKGRWFFSCPIRKCGFFQWDGNAVPAASSSGPSQALPPTQVSSSLPINMPKVDSPLKQKTDNVNSVMQLRSQPTVVELNFDIFGKTEFVVRGFHAKVRDVLKQLPFSKYNPSERGWILPQSQYEDCIKRLREISDIRLKLNGFPAHIVKLFNSIGGSPDKRVQVENEIKQRIPADLWSKLMPFQKEGVIQAIMRNGRILLGDEMGLGKTIQALTVCSFYESDWPVLVVCPSSLRLTWSIEIQKWLRVPEKSIDVIFNTKNGISSPTRKFVITSYEIAAKMGEACANEFNIVICDEAHYLKNKETKRAKGVCPLVQNSARALLLTGTPALSKPAELFSLANSLDKSIFTSFPQYGARYCDATRGPFGWNYSGASHLDELCWLLDRTILIRRLKKDVELELPPKTRQIIYVDISASSLREIQKLQKESKELRLISQQATGLKQRDAELRCKALLVQMWHETGRSKVPAVQEYLSEIYENSDKKFIVFAHHLEVLDSISDHLRSKYGENYIRIDGTTNQIRRQALVDQFQADKKTRVAILSLTAACTGLTLHAADLVIFAELFWNPSTLLQAEDRAHRIGRQGSVDIKYMLVKDTSDSIQWQMVRQKLRVVGKMLDNDIEKVTIEEGTSFGAVDPDLLSWCERISKECPQSDENDNITSNHRDLPPPPSLELELDQNSESDIPVINLTVDNPREDSIIEVRSTLSAHEFAMESFNSGTSISSGPLDISEISDIPTSDEKLSQSTILSSATDEKPGILRVNYSKSDDDSGAPKLDICESFLDSLVDFDDSLIPDSLLNPIPEPEAINMPANGRNYQNERDLSPSNNVQDSQFNNVSNIQVEDVVERKISAGKSVQESRETSLEPDVCDSSVKCEKSYQWDEDFNYYYLKFIQYGIEPPNEIRESLKCKFPDLDYDASLSKEKRKFEEGGHEESLKKIKLSRG